MARQHAAVDVVAAADLVPDHERNRLAFVEVGDRIGRGWPYAQTCYAQTYYAQTCHPAGGNGQWQGLPQDHRSS